MSGSKFRHQDLVAYHGIARTLVYTFLSIEAGGWEGGSWCEEGWGGLLSLAHPAGQPGVEMFPDSLPVSGDR